MNKIKTFILNNKSDIVFALILTIVSIVFSLNFAILNIQGSSMFPTYKDGDILLLKKYTETNKGDIVIFSSPETWGAENNKFIKRIIGVEGDRVTIKNESVVVNEKEIKHDKYQCNIDEEKTFIIPENKFLVMGDNIQNSNDSITQYCMGNEQYLIDEKLIVTTGKELFVKGGLFK